MDVIERPQQGAAVALSEYAPGRLVVVNKQTYRVAAVTADVPSETVDRAPPLFARATNYLQCPNCLYTAEVGTVQANSTCPICTVAQISSAIQPEVVWPEGRTAVDELDVDQTITDTTVAQVSGSGERPSFDTRRGLWPGGTLSHGRQVPLIIMNRGEMSATGPSGYQVCDRCGYTAIGGQPFPPRHDRQYNISNRGQRFPAQCAGTPQNVFLGYQFRTDVLLLRTPLDPPLTTNLADPALKASLISLASAVALTAADELDIDSRELQSGHRLLRTGAGAALADIYLYDALTGGAGYARLIGQDFERIYAATETRLRGCTCDTSCTKCLRTYSNRMNHSTLDRQLALDIAAYFRQGIAPPLLDNPRQCEVLRPAMLELDGWSCIPSPLVGLRVERSGRRHDIAVSPSLLDGSNLPYQYAQATVFSKYEIENDLPSCLLRLPS